MPVLFAAARNSLYKLKGEDGMKRSKGNLPLAAGMGYGTALLTTALLLGAAAWMMDRELLEERHMGEAAAGVLLLASFLGTGAAVRRAGRQPLAVGMAAGCAYLLTLLLLGAVAYGGAYAGVWVKAGIILAGSGGAVLTMSGGGKRRMKKYRKKTSR